MKKAFTIILLILTWLLIGSDSSALELDDYDYELGFASGCDRYECYFWALTTDNIQVYARRGYCYYQYNNYVSIVFNDDLLVDSEDFKYVVSKYSNSTLQVYKDVIEYYVIDDHRSDDYLIPFNNKRHFVLNSYGNSLINIDQTIGEAYKPYHQYTEWPFAGVKLNGNVPMFDSITKVENYFENGDVDDNINPDYTLPPVYDSDQLPMPYAQWNRDPVTGKLTMSYHISNSIYDSVNHGRYDIEAEYRFKTPNFFIVQDANKLGTSTYTVGWEGISNTESYPIETNNPDTVNLTTLTNFNDAKTAAQDLLSSATYQYRNSSGTVIDSGLTYNFLTDSSSQIRYFDTSPYVVPYVRIRFKKVINGEEHYSKYTTLYWNMPDQVITYDKSNPIDIQGDSGGVTDDSGSTINQGSGTGIVPTEQMKLSDYSEAFNTIKGMYTNIGTLPQYISSVMSLCPDWLINLIYAGIGFAVIIGIMKMVL